MTIKEIYGEELNNSQSITFHRGSIFLGVHEFSAYIVVSTIR